MEERQENRSPPCSSWATCSTAKRRQRIGTAISTLPIPAERKRRGTAPKTIQSSAAAYRDLNATLGNFYEQPKRQCGDGRTAGTHRHGIRNWKAEKREGSTMDEQVAPWKNPTSWRRSTWKIRTARGRQRDRPQSRPRAERRKEQKTRKAGDASGGLVPARQPMAMPSLSLPLAGTQPQFQHGGGRMEPYRTEHHTGMFRGAERDGRAGGQVAAAGADGGGRIIPVMRWWSARQDSG